ncbi:H-NS family nucleoid-associated regulatory protein [Variovorax paradoxus]|uniref:H-NS histone family protein n=1 Tax=Variovorax paradoxus TaxID=34073 RepID=UPI0019325B02|nr:H-NS histone family protein [Variovorax paradoxus]
MARLHRTYLQLRDEIAALQRTAADLLTAEKNDAIAKIDSLIATYNIAPSELTFAHRTSRPLNTARTKGRTPKKASVQFQDAAGNTWGGRGPRPIWLKQALKKRGARIEDFAIASSRQAPAPSQPINGSTNHPLVKIHVKPTAATPLAQKVSEASRVNTPESAPRSGKSSATKVSLTPKKLTAAKSADSAKQAHKKPATASKNASYSSAPKTSRKKLVAPKPAVPEHQGAEGAAASASGKAIKSRSGEVTTKPSSIAKVASKVASTSARAKKSSNARANPSKTTIANKQLKVSTKKARKSTAATERQDDSQLSLPIQVEHSTTAPNVASSETNSASIAE